jgi:hypothetical protein
MNVRTAEAALPMIRRVRSDIAHGFGASAYADPERIGEAVQRALRKSERLQPFIGETDIDGEPCAVLLLPRIETFEHVAQPRARFRAIIELDEDVTPVPHQNGRHDIVLNVVQILFQVSSR